MRANVRQSKNHPASQAGDATAHSSLLSPNDTGPVAVQVGGNEVLIGQGLHGLVTSPVIERLSADRFVVVWSEYADASQTQTLIRAQVFSSSGVAEGAAFTVNTSPHSGTPVISVAAYDQGPGWEPKFVVVWVDDSEGVEPSSFLHTDPSTIRSQVFNASGQPIGGEVLISTEAVAGQLSPEVTVAYNGRYYVTWVDYTADEDRTDDSAVRTEIRLGSFSFGISGGPNVIVANAEGIASRSDPSIVYFDPQNSKCLVAWSEPYGEGIVARYFFSNTTQPAGDEFVLVSGGAVDVEVTALEDGGFVATFRRLSGENDIYARVFDNQGVAVSDEFRVNTATAGTQNEASVVALLGGGFAVTWTDRSVGVGGAQGDTSNLAIKAQVYSADGSSVGTELLVNSATASAQYSPHMAALSRGGFVIVWVDSSAGVGGATGDASYTAIKAQVFSEDGTPLGAELLVNVTTEGYQLAPYVTALEDGSFAVGWSDYSEEGVPRLRIFNPEPLNGTESDDTLTGTAGPDTIDGLGGNDTIDGGAGNDIIRGGEGNDHLIGGPGDDYLDGGSGIDTLDYSASDSRILVNFGNRTVFHGPASSPTDSDEIWWVENLIATPYDDVISTDNTDNIIYGGGGRDFIHSQGGNDIIYIGAPPSDGSTRGSYVDAGDGDDIVYGNAGDDSISGGTGGIDRLYGGAGDDTYFVTNVSSLIFENAGEGYDTVRTFSDFYLYDNVEALTLTGYLNYFGVGNALDNVITGNTGDNLLLGGAGNDTVDGGAGNDNLFGEAGDDELYGATGIDYLVGGAGNDFLSGGDDADALYGEDGDDYLEGGNTFHTDILVGGAGNDILHGDSGLADYDLLDGDAGNDIYWVDTGDDLTFEDAGGGTDTVYADVRVANAGVYLYANVENLVLVGTTAFGVGNELDNALIGSESGNYLLGGAGNDVLDGRGGNDVLFGEAGNDVFVFQPGTGGDVIGDFTIGQDRIDLRAFGFANFDQLKVNFSQVGADGAINLGNGDFIVLHGVTMANLTAAQFIFPGQASPAEVLDTILAADDARFASPGIRRADVADDHKPGLEADTGAQILPGLSADDLVGGGKDAGPQILPGLEDDAFIADFSAGTKVHEGGAQVLPAEIDALGPQVLPGVDDQILDGMALKMALWAGPGHDLHMTDATDANLIDTVGHHDWGWM